MAPGTPFASMLRSKHICDCLLPLLCLALFSVLLYLFVPMLRPFVLLVTLMSAVYCDLE